MPYKKTLRLLARLRGYRAESLAHQYLLQHGLVCIRRNYRCRHGEIDLIMKDCEYLVFIEVRQRSSQNHCYAISSIDKHKQKKIILTAEHYLKSYLSPILPPCRFDIITCHSQLALNKVQWIKNAFEAGPTG